MKNSKKKKKNLLIKGLVLCLLFFGLIVKTAAQDMKKGALVVVHTKEGKTVKGELLLVKNDSIILMDSFAGLDIPFKVEIIKKVVIKKKGGVFHGLSVGGVFGGVGGALLGFLSGDGDGWFSAEGSAVFLGMSGGALGILFGGLFGAWSNSDEAFYLKDRNPDEMRVFWTKMKSLSRLQDTWPETLQDTAFPRKSFRRIHIHFRPGYLFSKGDSEPQNFLEKIGSPDIRVDYSISRNLAIGAGYARLGKQTHGLWINASSGGSNISYYDYMPEDFSGGTYFLSGSWGIFPDAGFEKAGLKVGISAGISDLRIHFDDVSLWGCDIAEENLNISKKGLALAGFLELDHYFSRTLNLGIHAEFRYLPVSIKPERITGFYQAYENSQPVTRPLDISIPQHNQNLGGFRFGINLGLHF